MEEVKKGRKIWYIFIIFLTSFVLGYFSCFLFLNKENINLTKEKNSWVFNNNNSSDLDLTYFWETYNYIKENYYSFDGIKKDVIVDGMIKWMVDSLWDKHSEFMTRKERKQFEETLSWDFEWIGAIVEKNELWVAVDMVLSGSPAKKAWILSWDIIVKAGEIELKDKDLYDAIWFIKWPAGSKVKLSIIRQGENDFIEKEVVREKITIPSVDSKYLEKEKMGYIIINIFWDNTYEEFKKALQELESKNIEGLILDLRDNGWGYLQSAVEILSLLVEDKEVLVKTKYRDSFLNKNYYSINDGKIFDKKIVVLVNGNSASASEITAWALKDYGKAIIVGEKTYWKWSVQEPFDVLNGGLLKITIAKWYTPQWISIEEAGITPDIEIKFQKEDYEKKYDRQLEEAKKILKSFEEKKLFQITIDEYKKENTSK